MDIDFGGYTPAAMEAAKVDGDYYAVPCDNLVRVLMYNKELLAGSSVLNEDGSLKLQNGYDSFMSMLGAAAAETGIAAPLALTMRPPQLVLGWLTMYEQLGGHDFINLENRTCVFDDALAVKALTMYQKIYADYVPENLAPPPTLKCSNRARYPSTSTAPGMWPPRPKAWATPSA